MARIIPTAVIAVVALSMLMPAMAQEEEEEAKIIPVPLPFSPDTSKFYIFASVPVGSDNLCLQTIQETHDITTSGQLAYAINNVDDPCAVGEQPTASAATGNIERVIINTQTPGSAAAIVVYGLPAIPAGTRMVAGEPIEGQITLFLAGFNNNVPVTFGDVKPTISLIVGDDTVGTWSAEGNADPLATPPTPSGDKIYFDFPFELGAATDTLAEGPARLVIDVSNAFADQDLNFVGSRVGLAVDPAHQGFLQLPFAQPPPPPPPPPTTTPTPTSTDGSGNGSGNGDGSNNTTAPPTPTGNTTATNNTTKPKDKGLPGFELAAVVAAGVVAAVAVERVRRRNPPASR